MATTPTGLRAARAKAATGQAAFRRPSAGALMLRRARDAALERAAIATCLVLAAVSGGWAAIAIADSPNGYDVRQIVPPIANGFAWKKGVAPARNAAIDLDPLTTGALPDRVNPEATLPSEAATQALPAKPGHPYVLRRVSGGAALVEGPNGLREVVPGAVLPGAGRVISIRQTGSGWIVVTSETLIGPTPL